MIIQSQFRPAWWLPTGHAQTIVPFLLRRNLIDTYIHEKLELPDGDFLELGWTEKPDSNTTKPIVIILHGIEGSIQSHYATRILSALKSQGWIGLFMHFRSCGQHPNRKPQCYNSGDTNDFRYLISLVSNHYPKAPLAAVGFSLGGNILSKYLGETSSVPLKAAVAVCAPLNLSVSADRINYGLSRVYRNYLMHSLKRKVRSKIQDGLIMHITSQQLAQINTLREFDHLITTPLYNFNSVDEYYAQASGWGYLKNIATPTLILHANDDPFINSSKLPDENVLSDSVTFEVSQSGGHIGFLAAGTSRFQLHDWLSGRIIAYLFESFGQSAE